MALGEAVDAASRQIVDGLDLPPDYRSEFIGQAKTLAETGDNFVHRLRA